MADPVATPQPPPAKQGGREVLPDLVSLLWARSDFGAQKYGVRLHTANGRDAYIDALQELLDLFVYLHQASMERAQLEVDLAQARADLASHVEALDRRCATLRAERDDALAGFETARRTFAGAQADLMARVETLREQLDAARANASKAMAERDAALLKLGRPAEGLTLPREA